MNRADLEALDRDTLVAKAESAGVLRPAVLTRPELVDELLVRTAKDAKAPEVRRARGFFGIARDLLARVIERGLNLPEAADLVRSEPAPARPARSTSSVIPTVTLAEIYATQGHKARAEETLRKVLETEPDHDAARLLLERLQNADLPAPKFALDSDDADADSESGTSAETSAKQADPSPPAEPMGMLDDAPLPPKYDVDECVAIAVDPKTIFVYWEIRDETRRRLERTRPGGYVALRLLIIEGTWDGPRTTSRDVEVHTSVGDWFMRDLPPGAVVRAAIGWQTADAFVPVAHSPALEAQPNSPSPLIADGLIRWTAEGPVRIASTDRDAMAIAHALGRVQEIERQRGRRGGSSELYALPPA
ncbi:MAG: DUF4912 domain-containing protein [Polyangiaceae bacterium]